MCEHCRLRTNVGHVQLTMHCSSGRELTAEPGARLMSLATAFCGSMPSMNCTRWCPKSSASAAAFFLRNCFFCRP